MTGRTERRPAGGSLRTYLFADEHQYAGFVALAIFFATALGFPLGLTLAHAAAQHGTLGGRFPQLVQLHGHIQLFAWFGLFVMGMAYRLVPRFTAVHLRQQWFVPATLVLSSLGLVLRSIGQPLGERDTFAAVFEASAVLEALGVIFFSATILRCVLLGRQDEFGYKPFFAAASVWLVVAMLLNVHMTVLAAGENEPVVPSGRSEVVTSLLLYGFVSMFVFGVSLRAFPVFFGRQRADPRIVTFFWFVLNSGIALYALAAYWRSYAISDALMYAQDAGFLLAGLGMLAPPLYLRIFEGTPHRLRETARRNMRFVRAAYAWLLLAAAVQVYASLRSLISGTLVHSLQTDAVRHFLALGFLTTVVIGMSFLVMPALAMRRLAPRPARRVSIALLALLQGAAAARGLGSLIADEGHFDAGFWTMTVGGTFGVLLMLLFAGYLVWSPRTTAAEEVALRERFGG